MRLINGGFGEENNTYEKFSEHVPLTDKVDWLFVKVGRGMVTMDLFDPTNYKHSIANHDIVMYRSLPDSKLAWKLMDVLSNSQLTPKKVDPSEFITGLCVAPLCNIESVYTVQYFNQRDTTTSIPDGFLLKLIILHAINNKSPSLWIQITNTQSNNNKQLYELDCSIENLDSSFQEWTDTHQPDITPDAESQGDKTLVLSTFEEFLFNKTYDFDDVFYLNKHINKYFLHKYEPNT